MEPFKNMLSADVARKIGTVVQQCYPAFDLHAYAKDIDADIAPLELKARMHHIADRLEKNLPSAPGQLFPILENTLARDEHDTEGLQGFTLWPLTEIISRRGQNAFELAMHALREMTQRFTAEFAIRSFLKNHQERTLAQLITWTSDPNEHVRRLASEGSRPLLPWGERLPALLAEPEFTRPILDQLHCDPSEYVRRSVANHLNDFSRTNSKHVIATLRRWQVDAHPTFQKTAARAARTLIKAGNPEALEIMGFSSRTKIQLIDFHIETSSIGMGEELVFSAQIKNPDPVTVPVMIDYAVFYRKANGSTSRKVFKGRKYNLLPNASLEYASKHSFRPITTRRYYPGLHQMELIINGCSYPPVSFLLNSAVASNGKK